MAEMEVRFESTDAELIRGYPDTVDGYEQR